MRNTKVFSLSLDIEALEILNRLSKESGLSKNKIISQLLKNANVKTIITLNNQ